MSIHECLDDARGLAFGLAVVRARVRPRWMGMALMVGAILVAVSSRLPDIAQTASAAVRDLAFGGMGASLLLARRGSSDVAVFPIWPGRFSFDLD